jgi:hypothetical protein
MGFALAGPLQIRYKLTTCQYAFLMVLFKNNISLPEPLA